MQTKLERLEVCESCSRELVYPIDYFREFGRKDFKKWNITLRCPDCFHVRELNVTEEVIERFDLVLEKGTDAIVDLHNRISYEIMQNWVDSFCYALGHDAIVADDF